jgi:RHS repeat-associated protein
MSDNGTVVWAATYESFGTATITTATITNNLRFPGQYFDSESGLQYNWHRYYDPTTGRYISADPIGLVGGINLYGYVQQDPINWVDPDGQTPCDPDKQIRCNKFCRDLGRDVKWCKKIGCIQVCKCDDPDCRQHEKHCKGVAKRVIEHAINNHLHPGICKKLAIAIKRAIAAGCGDRAGVMAAQSTYGLHCTQRDWSEQYPDNPPSFPPL